MNTEQLSNTTYKYDRLRGLFQGFGDAAWMTFIMLIAIRVFEAPSTLKALISGTAFLGYLLNPLTLSIGSKTHLKTTQICSLYLALCAICMFAGAFAPSLWSFISLMIAWQIAITQISPLMIQIYSSNYPPQLRGQRWSTSFMLASIVGSLFAYFGGKLLDINLNYYSWILITISIASCATAWCVLQIPSAPLKEKHSGNAWKNLSLIWKDKLFCWILSAWTLMSLAHWMLMPLRFEYMTDTRFGISASNQQIAIITFMIPAITNILTSKLWGYLFDRLHFMKVRIMINLSFLVGFILFFISTSIIGLALGSCLIGFASCGGMIASNIWVTKITVPAQTPAYMSAHSALSGLRGLIAPFLGYLFIYAMHPIYVSCIAAVMALVSSWMFYKAKNNPRIGNSHS